MLDILPPLHVTVTTVSFRPFIYSHISRYIKIFLLPNMGIDIGAKNLISAGRYCAVEIAFGAAIEVPPTQPERAVNHDFMTPFYVIKKLIKPKTY